MSNKSGWISTYQCQDCRRLVQVKYSCTGGKHKTKVMRDLDVHETNCLNCNKQITRNGWFLSGNTRFLEDLCSHMDMLESCVERLNGQVASIKSFIERLENPVLGKEHEDD